MTDEPSELNICPNCGKENLPMVTRCVHCGSQMESLYTIFGQPQASEEENEDSLPDIIEEIRNDPSLQVPTELKPSPETEPAGQSDEPQIPGDQLPDWLAKVRERAQGEEGAIGDLVSGTIAMDAVRNEEAAAGVEGEFNAWINRIREKGQQENSARARRLPSETDNAEQVPEWLQRIRALRPNPEDEITHEVKTPATYPDGHPREWTDQALEELRRQALAEEHEQETEPLPEASTFAEEEELPTEPETQASGETSQVEPQGEEFDFHNIPGDEEEYVEPVPAADLTLQPEEEAEAPAEEAAEQAPETEDVEKPEEEPAQQILQEESLPAEEFVTEEPLLEQETGETTEQAEVVAPLPEEEESELQPEEQEKEPEEEEHPADSGAVPPDLLLLRDQQDRASLLASLVEQEGRVTAGKQAIRKPSGRAGRLAVALLLIIGIIVSILIGPAAMPAGMPNSMPAMALNEHVQTLVESDQVLVVLDYHAATSRELEALAAPMLEQLHTRDVRLTFVTTQPSGLFLVRSLLALAGLPGDTEVDYLPGSYLNLISGAMNPEISATGDDLVRVKNLADFKLVLLVSDSSDSVRGWLEQIAPWIDSLKFGAVTTQMEAPVLSPYFDSGQLVGYSAGISDGNIAFNYRAYQVGLLLMLVMLLLGIISKGEADAIRREEERSE